MPEKKPESWPPLVVTDAIIAAAIRHLPSPMEIDDNDKRAFAKMVREILKEYLKSDQLKGFI